MSRSLDLDLLVGQWRGHGVAEFPTIERVEYSESLRVEWDSGLGVLLYEQHAVLRDGSSIHRESGFIRSLPDGRVELWNAQDNGRTEVLRGSKTWDDSHRRLLLDLRSVEIGNDRRVLESQRHLAVSEGRLRYEHRMATTTTPEPDVFPHLRCDLVRA